MKINQQNLKAKFGKNIYFQENLSKYSWFNLGGPAKIFFKPKNTEQLIEFLININNSQKITCLGAGSNTLIRDGGFEGAVIKLSPGFSFINLLNNETLEVGAGTLDKTLSRFGADNSITNYLIVTKLHAHILLVMGMSPFDLGIYNFFEFMRNPS